MHTFDVIKESVYWQKRSRPKVIAYIKAFLFQEPSIGRSKAKAAIFPRIQPFANSKPMFDFPTTQHFPFNFKTQTQHNNLIEKCELRLN